MTRGIREYIEWFLRRGMDNSRHPHCGHKKVSTYYMFIQQTCTEHLLYARHPHRDGSHPGEPHSLWGGGDINQSSHSMTRVMEAKGGPRLGPRDLETFSEERPFELS